MMRNCHQILLKKAQHALQPKPTLGSQNIFEKLKPQPEVPKNVAQFLGRSTEIQK